MLGLSYWKGKVFAAILFDAKGTHRLFKRGRSTRNRWLIPNLSLKKLVFQNYKKLEKILYSNAVSWVYRDVSPFRVVRFGATLSWRLARPLTLWPGRRRCQGCEELRGPTKPRKHGDYRWVPLIVRYRRCRMSEVLFGKRFLFSQWMVGCLNPSVWTAAFWWFYCQYFAFQRPTSADLDF